MPCSLVFAVNPVVGAVSGSTFPMTLDPSALTIPPASSGLLSVPFMPAAMGKFAAILEATVKLPGQPTAAGAKADPAGGAKLQICRLSGEGGLPSLSVELPKGFEEPGQPSTLRFSKLLKVSVNASTAALSSSSGLATHARELT